MTEKDRAEADKKWREEARFAGMHELGMCLRWGLARVVRIQTYSSGEPTTPSPGEGGNLGTELRGLIPWEHYTHWRDQEAALGYPPTHFATFLTSSPGIIYNIPGSTSTSSDIHAQSLPSPLPHILLSLFSLFARLTAHSASSGHTPPTLSPLFGPLVFGLGGPGMVIGFHETYVGYLKAVGAMEHVLLAFVRWQDSAGLTQTQPNSGTVGEMLKNTRTATGTTLGVPTRLKEWIKGYPSMLSGNFAATPSSSLSSSYGPPSSYHPTHGPSDGRTSVMSNISGPLTASNSGRRPEPRKGARTVRVISVRRNVRQYERDLVRAGAKWGEDVQLVGSFAAHSSIDLNASTSSSGSTGSMGGGRPSGTHGLTDSREWERIVPGLPKGYVSKAERESYGSYIGVTKPVKMPPRYTEPYRKRLALPPNHALSYPELGSNTRARGVYDLNWAGESQPALGEGGDGSRSGEISRTASTYSTSSSMTSGSDFFSSSPTSGSPTTSLSSGPSLSSFKSLTDMRWGEFEMGGFGGLGSDRESSKALQFDLGESARLERLNWGRTRGAGGSGLGSGSLGLGGGGSGGSSPTVGNGMGAQGNGHGTGRKRESVIWNDFSQGGFDRVLSPPSSASDGGPLERMTSFDDTLAFNPNLTDALKEWPKDRTELVRKLKKREKALPPFGWDTSPVVGTEEVIEEAFIDVFCDLIYGSGWGLGLEGMKVVWGSVPVTSESLNRAAYGTPSKDKDKDGKGGKDKDKDDDEDVMLDDRECNWALVEFKSLPQASGPVKLSISTSSLSSSSATHPIIKLNPNDPRTGSTLLLFEEFVPLEYREQLAALAGSSSSFSFRKRLPSLFSPGSNKPKSKNVYKSSSGAGGVGGVGVSSTALSMSKKKKKLASTGGKGKNGEWKAAPTLNGRPYVVGSVPKSPSYREAEFEGLLRNEGSTTRLTMLGGRAVENTDVLPQDMDRERDVHTPTQMLPRRMERATTPTPGAPLAQSTMVGQGQHAQHANFNKEGGAGSVDDHSQDSHLSSVGNTPSKEKEKRAKFRLPVSPGGPRKVTRTPMEYSSVDFETRLTTGSDSTEDEEEDDYGTPSDKEGANDGIADEDAIARRRKERLMERDRKRQERRERRQSRGLDGQDAWVDIVVGSPGKRMGGQDAEKRRRAVDPDQAGLEVAQVLSAVRAQGAPVESDDEEDGRRVLQSRTPYGRESQDMEDVDEIERVPAKDKAVYDDEDEIVYSGSGVAGDRSTYGYSEDGYEDEEPEPEPESERPKKLGYFDLHPDRRPLSTASFEDPRARIMQDEEDEEDEGVAGVSASPPARPLPTLPPSNGTASTSNGHAPATSPPAAPAKLASKTAALIAMYQEKERTGAPVIPPPSRIPLRRDADTSPSASSSPSPAPQPAAPTPRRPMPETPKPKPAEPDTPPEALEPPKMMIEDQSGRASPGRYIHGAPLHNVMEEEEEEDSL
ncbi:hypothetical protein D9758_014682 [Tetrapyrgos nigripes]|uniref:Meiotically up-regulated protein Msb1/Mug8 domain-containing protein n=1 Tax=Tetrapyrgos nigripes TaxID=182062 RepID=A0A8H5FP50_9AGAR|nr:hypothetical protein D9758_014682 [Tetrapyrgos nigripes]